MSYRKLKKDEIDQLIKNGCVAKDWQKIKVVENFKPENIKNIEFSGEIFIGNFDTETELYPGFSHHYGLYNSSLHNCKISDNVLIKDVKLLMNYDIEENAVIINSDKIELSYPSKLINYGYKDGPGVPANRGWIEKKIKLDKKVANNVFNITKQAWNMYLKCLGDTENKKNDSIIKNLFLEQEKAVRYFNQSNIDKYNEYIKKVINICEQKEGGLNYV